MSEIPKHLANHLTLEDASHHAKNAALTHLEQVKIWKESGELFPDNLRHRLEPANVRRAVLHKVREAIAMKRALRKYGNITYEEYQNKKSEGLE